MKIIDISWPIEESMTEYKNRKSIQFLYAKIYEEDHVRESLITVHNHTGTHVDAPAHFLEHGQTIDQIPLEKLIGNCIVADLTQVTAQITAEEIKKLSIHQQEIILFKTKNSQIPNDAPFNPNFVFLEKTAAQLLAAKKIKAVGFDYLGIERNQPNHETHKILLERGIPVIEGLRLNHVKPGNYFFCCLPLAFQGLDAAPARAVLFQK